MKDIFKKILISLTAFILVLSISFTHLNTSKRFEVQASEYSITQQVAAVIAVLMAAAGIQLVNEPTLGQMQNIYDSLSIEAQGVLSSPTLGNNIVEDMIALPYSQAQTVLHSLVDTFQAWNLTDTPNYYLGNLSVPYDVISLSNFVANSTTLLNNTNFKQGSMVRNYTLTYSVDFVNINCIAANSCNYYAYEMNFSNFTYFYSVPYRNADGNVYTMIITDATNYPQKFVHTTKATVNGWMNWYTTFNNTWTMGFDSTVDAYALALVGAAGLTLPAPAGGWENSEPNDLDLEGWTKGLNIPDVGDVVVLGGLAAGTLAGLSPEAVLVPSSSQTPFDPSTEPEDPGTEDPYNPPPAENMGWFAAWTAAALGATSALFGFDPMRDAFAAIQNAIQGVVQPIIDAIVQLGLDLITGLTTAFQTMLQPLLEALIQPFLQAFSALFTWDIPATKLKLEELRTMIFIRIPCVNETMEAWYQIMAVSASDLTGTYTIFGETYVINTGDILNAFKGFGSLIKQAFRFVFWFIFLKGMRRRVTSFLGLVSTER